MELISLITCTGHRPEAFKLCQSFVQRQTYKGPVQWIVVDDSISPKATPGTIRLPNTFIDRLVMPGPKEWQEGFNTQRDNMNAALRVAEGEYIFIIEDDELYKPTYIERTLKLLQYASAVGEVSAKYYHVGLPGYKEMRNYIHASLCQTAIKKNLKETLLASINSGELYFDIHFWDQIRNKCIPAIMTADSNGVISMKGMPGRTGIGIGHKTKDYILDPKLVKLKEWCGADTDLYLPFIKRKDEHKRDNPRVDRQSSPPPRALETPTKPKLTPGEPPVRQFIPPKPMPINKL